MATNVPPHNLGETIDACFALMENPDIPIPQLMEYLPGPDFPTAGIINGYSGIREAYETGRGRIHVRARAEIETSGNGRESIVIHELPYQVNKARLIEKIARLVKNRNLGGISAIRDESDKSGMRVVIEIKRGEQAEVILNNLYKQTSMQTVFGINIVALSDNRPRVFNLKDVLNEFIKHRREVVTRRTVFELGKARDRAHVLEGLAVALSNIDPVIALIRAAKTSAEARERLLGQRWEPGAVARMLARSGSGLSRPGSISAEYGLGGSGGESGYRLSPGQAQAILDLRLHRLTGLEQEKIHREYQDVVEDILALMGILSDPDRLVAVIRGELKEIRDRYNDDRRTEIIEDMIDLSREDLIPEEDMVVTISHESYAKSQPVSDYSAQKRGGKGRVATRTKDEDFVKQMFVAHSHDIILCFSDMGKVYWLRTFELTQAGRQARGRPLVNLLPLDSGEQVTAMLPIKKYEEGGNLLMATALGFVKKCKLSDFSKPRSSGLRAVSLQENDHLVGVAVTNGSEDILLVSDAGKAIRFSETVVRVMGRTARGVRGIRMKPGNQVIALIALPDTGQGNAENNGADEPTILTATENGYGKRTLISDFPRKGRAGQGVIAMKTSDRNGKVVSAHIVNGADEVMLITDGGILIRTRVGEISTIGRNVQGVRLISLGNDDRLVCVSNIVDPDNAGDE